MIRVVIDANVLVSALVGAGPSSRIVAAVFKSEQLYSALEMNIARYRVGVVDLRCLNARRRDGADPYPASWATCSMLGSGCSSSRQAVITRCSAIHSFGLTPSLSRIRRSKERRPKPARSASDDTSTMLAMSCDAAPSARLRSSVPPRIGGAAANCDCVPPRCGAVTRDRAIAAAASAP